MQTRTIIAYALIILVPAVIAFVLLLAARRRRTDRASSRINLFKRR